LFAGTNVISSLIVEMVGLALVGGLFVFVIQRLTGATEKLGDEIELLNNEMERMRVAHEKALAAAVSAAEKPRSQAQRPAPAVTPIPQPTPVAVAPTPPPPPPKPKTAEELLEEQLEHELESIHFDDILAEYQAEREEARARGEDIDDDDDGGTFISG
jgi:hypothetical protein